jgi:hypothetical protein
MVRTLFTSASAPALSLKRYVSILLLLAPLHVSGQEIQFEVSHARSSAVPDAHRLPAAVRPASASAPPAELIAEQQVSHAINATPISSKFTAQQLAEIEQMIAEYGVPQSQPVPASRFGYDNGFVWASPSGIKVGTSDMPFALRINSWFQLRHTLFDSDGPNPDQNDIEFERVRLTFGGHAYTPDLQYYIQLDGDGDQGELIDLLDYYFRYDLGHNLFDWQNGQLGIQVGKWKLPFNRTRAEAGWQLEFTDRSMASAFFDINRSQGVGIFGSLEPFRKTVNFETAVFNGFQTEGALPGRSRELDRNLGCSTRVYSDLIGEWGKDGEPDLTSHDHLAMRVGSGFAYTRADIEGIRESTRQRVVDSGATLASILPAGVTAYDIFFYAVDMNFKYQGLSFHSEYYLRSLSNFAGAPIPGLFDHGFLLQTGYFIFPETLELAARWSRISGDSGTLGVTDQSADEVAAAVIWYIRGHNVKLTFDATHLNGAPLRDSALNILPGDAGWLFRSQLQMRF